MYYLFWLVTALLAVIIVFICVRFSYELDASRKVHLTSAFFINGLIVFNASFGLYFYGSAMWHSGACYCLSWILRLKCGENEQLLWEVCWWVLSLPWLARERKFWSNVEVSHVWEWITPVNPGKLSIVVSHILTSENSVWSVWRSSTWWKCFLSDVASDLRLHHIHRDFSLAFLRLSSLEGIG